MVFLRSQRLQTHVLIVNDEREREREKGSGQEKFSNKFSQYSWMFNDIVILIFTPFLLAAVAETFFPLNDQRPRCQEGFVFFSSQF